jgi:S-adenosylmethionine:tRNA ribosyltransferase-isomerase
VYSLCDYDYELPPERIAQTPAGRRDRSRLLRLERGSGTVSHHRFEEVARLLRPGDLLVVNDTAVIPARLTGRKPSGGKVEVFLLDYTGGVRQGGRFACDCLVKASKPVRNGSLIHFGEGWSGRVTGKAEGVCRIEFSGPADIDALLDRLGHVPLPPYIRRGDQPADRTSYQTVYAAVRGAVAAPTAGLHFTPRLLAEIRAQGVGVAAVTLHVGYGTFAPVRAADIRSHRIHSERYRIGPEAAAAVNAAREEGRRVVAVGTTAVRTLEHAAGPLGRVQEGEGWCDLFIYPGYRFKTVGAMLTNFHLPQSTLLMLVAAFAGRETILAAYREAIAAGYRFYSYGDAMLIE